MTYQQHIEQLARQLGAHIKYEENEYGGALTGSSNTQTGVLTLSPWTEKFDAMQYWIALHELGHLAHNHIGSALLAFTGRKEQITRQEAEAWTWALDHSAFPLRSDGRVAMAYSMTSYAQTAGWPDDDVNVQRVAAAAGRDIDWQLAYDAARIEPPGRPSQRQVTALWHRAYDEAQQAAEGLKRAA